MGAGFDAYLNSLQQRRQMEAETFARKKAEKAYMISSIANAGAEVVNAFAQNKQANDYAKRAYVELGMPGADKVKTATDIKAEKVLAKISAIRSGLSQPFNELDANIQSYNKELNDLNRQLAELDDYKRTPEYTQERVDTGFKSFVGGNKYNRDRLLSAYEEGQNQQIQEAKDNRELSMYEKKKAIDLKYAKPSSSSVSYDKKKSYLDPLQKRIETIKADLTLSKEEQDARINILQSGMDNIGIAKDDQEVEKYYNDTLKNFNSYKPTEIPKNENRKERRAREKAEKQAKKDKEEADYQATLKSLIPTKK